MFRLTFCVETVMYIYRLVLLLMVIIYLLSPSIMEWWVTDDGMWYKPYLFWLMTIIATILLQGKHDVDEL